MIRPLLLLAVGLTCVATAARADDDHIALVKTLAGQMGVVRKGDTLPATPGMNLYATDRVVTAAGASAGITFRDGTRLSVGPLSELQLRDYVFKPEEAQYAFDVYLAKGSALYASGKLAKLAPESVKISTPTATVGVRGTQFIIEAE